MIRDINGRRFDDLIKSCIYKVIGDLSGLIGPEEIDDTHMLGDDLMMSWLDIEEVVMNVSGMLMVNIDDWEIGEDITVKEFCDTLNKIVYGDK